MLQPSSWHLLHYNFNIGHPKPLGWVGEVLYSGQSFEEDKITLYLTLLTLLYLPLGRIGF